MRLTKKKYNKIKSKKSNTNRNKNRNRNTHYKKLKKNYRNNTKKYKKFRKNMKGGIATFSSSNSSSGNIGSVPLGNGKFSFSSYTNSDTPSAPPSVVSYVPSPIMDLKWSIDSGLKNFFNGILGQPKQLTSSPTDQPIGKVDLPITPEPITASDLNNFKTSILELYSNNANKAN